MKEGRGDDGGVVSSGGVGGVKAEKVGRGDGGGVLSRGGVRQGRCQR